MTVIIKDKKYGLYLANTSYGESESWTGLKKEAHRFTDEEEAAKVVNLLSSHWVDIIYIHIEDKYSFQINIKYDVSGSMIWFMRDVTEIEAIDAAAKCCERLDIKVITIVNTTMESSKYA